MEKEYVGIRQATKGGYIKCEIGGVADFLYPTSKLRRGRVQGGGQICPTLTAENSGVCRVEKNIKALDEQNGNLRDETFGTLTTDGSSPKHNNRVVEIEQKKKEHQQALDEENEYYEYLFGEKGVYYPQEDVTKGKSANRVDWSNTEYRIRKLTAKECYLLMDVTEDDADKMLAINSQTQCYKQAGNSIIVSVLCAVYSQLNIQGIKPWNERTLREQYDLVANPNSHK